VIINMIYTYRDTIHTGKTWHPPVLSGVCVTQSLVLFVCFVDRYLSYFFWSLCYLSFFDLQIMITPLVSSNYIYLQGYHSYRENLAYPFYPTNRKKRHYKFKRQIMSFKMKHLFLNQATSGAGAAFPSRAPEFTASFKWGLCYSIFSFICMLCRSLFVSSINVRRVWRYQRGNHNL
jgi:hypothetical protein